MHSHDTIIESVDSISRDGPDVIIESVDSISRDGPDVTYT